MSAAHRLGRIVRDSEGDLLAICACGERDCAQPWDAAVTHA